MLKCQNESLLSNTSSVDSSVESLLAAELLETKEKTGTYIDLEAVTQKKSVVESTVKRRILLIGIALCSSCARFNGGSMGPVIWRISHDFQDYSNTSWYVASFLLSSSIFQLIAVRISLCLGRRRTAISGIVSLAIGSLICVFSKNSTMFICIRIIQGSAAGLCMTMSAAVLIDLFPSDQRKKYQPLKFISVNTTRIIGPFLGGLFCDYGSWRWVFAFNTIYAVPVLVIYYFLLEIPIKDEQRLSSTTLKTLLVRIDFVGCILIILSVVGLVQSMNLGSTHDKNGWSLPVVIALLVGSCIVGGMLILYEKFVSSRPLFPSKIVTDRNMILVYILEFISGVYSIQLTMFTVFRSMHVYGATPTLAGVIVVPGVICNILGSITERCITQKTRCPKACIISGSLFVLLSTLLTMFVQTIHSSIAMQIGFIMLFGYGIGLAGRAMGASAVLIVTKKDKKLIPQAVALSQFFILIGCTLGFSVLITLLRTFIRQGLSALKSTQIHGFDLLKELESSDTTTAYALKQVYFESLSKTLYTIVACAIVSFLCAVFIKVPNVHNGSKGDKLSTN